MEGIIAEPAGALASTAVARFLPDLPDGPIACVVSGGNNDVSRYDDIVERSSVYEGLRHYFLVTFPQEPGALRHFLDGVLTDGELDSYEAQADEFASTGVHQNGAPTIENPGIVGVSDDGATVSVQACVDSSSVHVLDDQGTDLHASQPKRSLTIFMLTNSNGSWKISGESFPDDPTC